MPELPEVQVIASQLKKELLGSTFTKFQSSFPKSLKSPIKRMEELYGEVVLDVFRNGKTITIVTGKGNILIHLRMTGRLLLRVPDGDNKYVHHCFSFSKATIYFHDVRKFGTIAVVDFSPKILDYLDRELTSETLYSMLKSKPGSVKQFLLDQAHVAGAGNIYANDALFLSGIHPAKPSKDLTLPQVSQLLENLRSLFNLSLSLKGASARDFRDLYNESGDYLNHAKVYSRAGMPCLECNATIEKITQNGRSSFFCPNCQRL